MIDPQQSLKATNLVQKVCIIVLAHNEEDRIGACLESVPRDDAGCDVHVVVNGTKDRTAQIARSFSNVSVHDYAKGGKSRSWNRIMFDTRGIEADAYVFVDGDAIILPGSIKALVMGLATPGANAASGLPANGRQAEAYRASILREHGMFGALYALSGEFVARMRANNIRLPEDLIGDDGLIGAIAKTDLASEINWRDSRVVPCPDAQFLCDPIALTPASLKMQMKRMRNYSLRYFQNQIISVIMRNEGPTGLPKKMALLYPEYEAFFKPRSDPRYWWFDRQALAEIRAAGES